MASFSLTELTPCAECGMPCRSDEYHPFAACLMFKQCHNSQTVRDNLHAVEYGALRQQLATVEARCRTKDEDYATLKASHDTWIHNCEQAEAERERALKVLQDMRDNGLRFDLNPCHDMSNPEPFWHRYIRDADTSIRERAGAAIAAAAGDAGGEHG